MEKSKSARIHEMIGVDTYDGASPEQVAEAVLKARKAMGWKQFALADTAGVTERTIQRLERGERVSRETFLKVVAALNVGAGAIEPDSETPEQSFVIQEMYRSVVETAKGLHGTEFGFSRFLRSLPDSVLQTAARSEKLRLLILLHAIAIVNGSSEGPIAMDALNDDQLHMIRLYLTIEHFRRLAYLRARYPRDPFAEDEAPEIAWWTSHPFLQGLNNLPQDQRDTYTRLLLETGDTGILIGLIVAIPDDQMEKFAEQVEAINSHLEELLTYFEEEHGDSQIIAWSEPM
jgi:transcriptional regulator with XRE-family HTH domain